MSEEKLNTDVELTKEQLQVSDVLACNVVLDPEAAADEIVYLRAELAKAREVMNRQPMDTAPKKQFVLLHCRNGYGKDRILIAIYFRPVLHEDVDPYEGCIPNGPEEWLCPAAWYEWADMSEEGLQKVTYELLGWWPLPQVPATQAMKGGK